MKKRSLMAVVTIGTLLSAGSIIADELDDRWYLAPSVSYIGADSNRQADDDFGFQLGLGKPLSDSWNLELSGVIDSLERENDQDEFKQRGLLFDGLYFFNREPRFSPYGVIGLGAMRNKFAGEKNTNALGNIGLGFLSRVTDGGLRLRGDVRYRVDDDDASIPTEDRFNDWVVNLGLMVPLGASKAAAAPVAVAALDSDGDGVPDDQDRCADTPVSVSVGAQGCELDSDGDGVKDSLDRCPNSEAGTGVDARGCALDSDGDGVPDHQDRCLNTTAGATVDVSGCEADSDGDGIGDSRDRCPESNAGAKVDVNGCEIPEVLVLEGVTFATGSAILTGESQAILDEVAQSLTKHPTMNVEVAGYTDDRGSRALNEALSQQRADAVASYLIGQGVTSANLSARGYGPADPVASNGTAQGRALNRRVELHILSR